MSEGENKPSTFSCVIYECFVQANNPPLRRYFGAAFDFQFVTLSIFCLIIKHFIALISSDPYTATAKASNSE